ncbi:MAG: VIT domain-containing protein, partial [Planctomycetota bacterium]
GDDDEIAELLGSGQELWILERATVLRTTSPRDDRPGSGSLVAQIETRDEPVPLPLEHTDVKAGISGYIATVDVTQRFHNPFDTKIEAVYVFPLPQNAAVTDFLMKVGERTIRGVIREREEAQRIYKRARRAGYVAALLTQERPNIFTQRVANIEPGKKIDISIQYFNAMKYRNGEYEFVFPMVVGPRYNPPMSRDGVGSVARGAAGSSGQSTEVSYLRPGERSGHDIALALEIDAGVGIEAMKSVNHVVDTKRLDGGRRRIVLSPNDTVPNKDFVLRYRVAGERIKSDILVQPSDEGSYFTLMLFPPKSLENVKRQPVEFVFVLDCSGSMSGLPLDKCKRTVARSLRKLGPQDTFQIIRFSSSASRLGSTPIAATPANIRRGLDYLDSLHSKGGTEMIEGIRAALSFPTDGTRQRLVSFLTDGFIGNEEQIFAEIHKRLGKARIFSFGIGTSVNRHLLEGMARLGRGAVAYISVDEGVEEVVDQFYDTIAHPALTDIKIDWGGLKVRDVFPKRLPDLFVGRPVLVTGRIDGRAYGDAKVRVSGLAGRVDADFVVSASFADSARHPGVEKVWARKHIEVLSDHLAHVGGTELSQEIERVALEHNLVSRYTAFLAVDSLTRTDGSFGVEVRVGVPVPDGVRYETTVGK